MAFVYAIRCDGCGKIFAPTERCYHSHDALHMANGAGWTIHHWKRALATCPECDKKAEEQDLAWCHFCHTYVEPVCRLNAQGLQEYCEDCGEDLELP